MDTTMIFWHRDAFFIFDLYLELLGTSHVNFDRTFRLNALLSANAFLTILLETPKRSMLLSPGQRRTASL